MAKSPKKNDAKAFSLSRPAGCSRTGIHSKNARKDASRREGQSPQCLAGDSEHRRSKDCLRTHGHPK